MKPQRKRLHRSTKCRVTGKRRYEFKIDCLIDNATNPRTIRAYECPHCGDFHATSKRDRFVTPAVIAEQVVVEEARVSAERRHALALLVRRKRRALRRSQRNNARRKR